MDNLKASLDKIQADIVEVKRQYDFFFLGTRRTEPTAERRALEETIRKLGQRRIVNSTDQFRFNSLQGRYYALANLWTRIVRDMEEGRLGRDAAGALSRAVPRAADATAPECVDAGHIELVVAQVLEARQECGMPAGENEAAVVRETLLRRAREIAGSDGKKVEFKVFVEDGKPKIKATTRQA